jgi:chromosome segregation ATPase
MMPLDFERRVSTYFTSVLDKRIEELKGALEEKDREIKRLKENLQKEIIKFQRYRERVKKVLLSYKNSEMVRKNELEQTKNLISTIEGKEKELVNKIKDMGKSFNEREKELLNKIMEKENELDNYKKELLVEKEMWKKKYQQEIQLKSALKEEILKKSKIFDIESNIKEWNENLNDIKIQINRLKRLIHDKGDQK